MVGMKKINLGIRFIILVTVFISLTSGSIAQVTLNCESGNRGIEQGNCWGFGATSYSNTANIVIDGSWSVRTNSLTNMSPSACWVKTPWMLVGSGNITFQARLDGNGNGAEVKRILVAYIPYVEGASYGEGTPVQFFVYDFPAFNVSTIRDISVPLPAVIQNSDVAYKFWISFVGKGGSQRAYADNFVFPGTYWSDIANSCLPRKVIKDADADGVSDVNDNYPNDPYRAYNSYYPSQTTYGTLAFEDSWPNRADYDLNDLVVNYRFNTVTNAKNNVVELIGNIVTRASGASYKNGFGFQLDGIAPDKIIGVSGNRTEGSTIVTLQSNGLEANQQYANCIVFDDFFKIMKHPGSGTGINTSPGVPFVPYDTLTVTLKFIDNGVLAPGGAVPISALSPDKLNFYMIVNQQRGVEVHLADRVPTDMANKALFGTGSDDSDLAKGKYYKTTQNLPYAINVLQGFDYPIEKESIDAAYLHFVEWAYKKGAEFPDWCDKKPGYRNGPKVY